ncbi:MULTISPECIES: biosynthetic-type acetolactate synthase large subunit [Bacillota]|uniref:Acetolactate synthase n=2 Tax=Amedibacillus TaxID=2749846 RepID=A0A7G9GLD0_9FIRM|nr:MULTISPECIES: biosynthetic-type acetolactate synthase large subunit [Bacillota]QNM11612.1 biosynthetic-type acetolactate synthase large subunit [[Eubacterium] hominis]MCH4285142.1 biosynthetic-type acetolactate synthase large subunit [Amedibacillus hominis]RGB56170.1 biosynthetic-type acetolactate synthase large subunit [Absiella sp. AM22-9]RGB61931.1 biosynthetic-type acetolactate synthase large subunit [Absiella sp. AM10-20]RGB70247.1 biosynthetic-type acetolactate synthase large subunit 
MKMNGSQILIQALIDQGVDTIFGYPGGSVLNIYDALYERSEDIRHIVSSHEQGAAHAADGYARSTGKTGVCLATSGPGATNLVTGIATAYMDSIPLIAITGNVSNDLLGRDSFQEVNIAGITMPITKHNFIVQHVDDLAAIVRKAFVIANSGRKGPVLIDIPKDVTAAVTEYVKLPRYRIRKLPKVDDEIFEQALEEIMKAKRPMIYAGGGVLSSNATKELLKFSKHMDIPISCSMMGLSSVPFDYDLYLGMIGMHGTPVSNYATLNTDLIIAIGARFSDRVAGNREEFGKNAKIIHFDIDASEISKNVATDISIVGDARYILKKMIQRMPETKHKEWTDTLKDFKTKVGLPTPKEGDGVDPRDLATTLHKIVGEDAIIVTDVGQHQMIMAQYYQFSRPRSFISSCGLGTMGFGMGAAIGTKVANPNRPVVLVTGDGSFHMNMNEMAVAVSENIPIVVLIFNNTVLGMVRQWQTLFYEHRYSNTSIDRKTDYVKLAEAFGAKGFRIHNRYEIENVMKEAIKSKVPCIVDCMIDKDDCVYPIIPPGKSGKDIILYGN